MVEPGATGDPVPVLFIGGWGRSGSTLLECLLSELGGVTVLGEVVHLAERGLRLNERCACGEPFAECPFWSAVGERAFGGWANVDPDRLAVLKDAADRQRRVVHTARRRLPGRLADQVAEYAQFYRRIYQAAAEITGARVVVDSSKEISTALAVSHDPAIALRVVHIVRDSRGVAYSWAKTVTRPEAASGEVMTKYSPVTSTVFWISGNLLPSALRHRGVRVSRMRYEDLVDKPQETIAGAWEELGLPGEAELPFIGSNEVELHGTHSVAGNPMRFRQGPTTLRRDEQWVAEMAPRDRALVTALSLPLLWRFGYPVKPARRSS